jgi:hypothetical protein
MELILNPHILLGHSYLPPIVCRRVYVDGNLCFHAVIITFPVLAPIKHVKEELSIAVQQQGSSVYVSCYRLFDVSWWMKT